MEKSNSDKVVADLRKIFCDKLIFQGRGDVEALFDRNGIESG
ncbi:hypothetical protein [Enterovibrio nigricans]|uniref:Uncharacterized protein n=1 Tax=Enterovibrio nigricans DSM 22720 TaxID=1121868 RepID=A0A1T4UUX0_9GAMM|nr:hypothetical protein [Enterovibrio nigricans]SKA56405.1 hypothetical protein SAMN02745132_02572 [Enterovibrio nigricans DSM 22720]